MAFFRRWHLILFALMLGAGPSFAASSEQRAYTAARQAFDDKFYSVAETRLTQFLQNYHRSTNAPMAVLLLAQSEFYQKNYSAATNRLADPANLARAKAAGLADSYVYWQAEAQFAQGDLAGAAQTFVSLTEKYPGSSLALSATVAAAEAFARLGRWAETDNLLDQPDGPFQRAVQQDPASGQVSSGRLLLAESKNMQKRFSESISILNLLDPGTLTTEQSWKRAYLLYLAQSGLNNLDDALAATTSLLKIARPGNGDVWATNLAESVASRASVLERQGRLAEAAAALQENLTNTAPMDQQQRTVLKLADLAMAQKNLTNAEAVLESFRTQFSDSPASEIALLTLGELHLKDFVAQPSATNHLAMAKAKMDQCIAISPNDPLLGRAFLDRGWCHWLEATNGGDPADSQVYTQKMTECLADFQAATEHLPMSEDLAVARFKVGDAQFALNDFSAAQTSYQAVLTGFSAIPQVTNSLAIRALYQILRAHLALHEVTGMDDTMNQLLENFFTSAPAESGMLLVGQGHTDFDSPAKARSIFLGFAVEHKESPLMPKVAFATARTFEREQNWSAAVTNYQTWLQAYPTNELRPQVEYALDWAVSQTGDDARAFSLFTNFVARYTNSLTPLAYWWVADHYFQLGTNYVAAEQNYESIFQVFPTNDLAYPAQLMAARAAMGRFDYKQACTYLSPLVDNCPTNLPTLATQIKFAYCEALRHSTDTNNANLVLASNILIQICLKYPTNEPGALAWSEIANCNYQFGAYDAATNEYVWVLNLSSASLELRNLAHVQLGMVLEKKAEGLSAEAQQPLYALALEHYLDVIYTTNAVADPFWTKKAALQALRLMPLVPAGDVDQFINRLEYWLPQLKETLEKKRAAARKN